MDGITDPTTWSTAGFWAGRPARYPETPPPLTRPLTTEATSAQHCTETPMMPWRVLAGDFIPAELLPCWIASNPPAVGLDCLSPASPSPYSFLPSLPCLGCLALHLASVSSGLHFLLRRRLVVIPSPSPSPSPFLSLFSYCSARTDLYLSLYVSCVPSRLRLISPRLLLSHDPESLKPSPH